jgi:hypothetical protein
MLRHNKLERFSQTICIAYPNVYGTLDTSSEDHTSERLLSFSEILEKLALEKHSSLFLLSMNDQEKGYQVGGSTLKAFINAVS